MKTLKRILSVAAVAIVIIAGIYFIATLKILPE